MRGRGATEVKTARDVGGRSTVVFLCVTGSPEVEGVVRGPDGLVAGWKTGIGNHRLLDIQSGLDSWCLWPSLLLWGIDFVDAR